MTKQFISCWQNRYQASILRPFQSHRNSSRCLHILHHYHSTIYGVNPFQSHRNSSRCLHIFHYYHSTIYGVNQEVPVVFHHRGDVHQPIHQLIHQLFNWKCLMRWFQHWRHTDTSNHITILPIVPPRSGMDRLWLCVQPNMNWRNDVFYIGCWSHTAMSEVGIFNVSPRNHSTSRFLNVENSHQSANHRIAYDWNFLY